MLEPIKFDVNNIDYLIYKCMKERCELSISIMPNGETTIDIRPWQPLAYKSETKPLDNYGG